MKSIGLSICLLLLSFRSWGCMCGMPPPLTAEILKAYPYVALVKVVSLEKVAMLNDTSQRRSRTHGATFTFEVVENFKDKLPTKLMLDSYGTSCDIGLRPGQTWLIFAKDYKGFPNVNACDYSVRYDTATSIRDLTGLRYRLAEELLNTVRQLTGRPIQSKNGQIERFYSNGQRALLAVYKSDGAEERTVWHENGRLRGKEFYHKGLKHGPAIWWYDDGTLNSTERFENGIAIDTSRYWSPTDSILGSSPPRVPSELTNHALDSLLHIAQSLRLKSLSVRDNQGRVVLGQQFDRRGQIRSETIGSPEAGMEWSTAYSEQGQINFLIVMRLSGSGRSQERRILYRIDYEKDGSREVAYYDEKHRLLRWTKVQNGTETVLQQNHYKD